MLDKGRPFIDRGYVVIVAFLILVFAYYNWQVTQLINENRAFIRLGEDIIHNSNGELESYEDLYEQIDKLKRVVINITLSNGKIIDQFEQILIETQEIKDRTKELNSLFYEKKNQ